MTEERVDDSPVSSEPSVFPEIFDRTPVVSERDAAEAEPAAEPEPLVLKSLDRPSILEHIKIREWLPLAAWTALAGLICVTLVHVVSTPDVPPPTIAAVGEKTLAPQEAVQNTPSPAPTIPGPSPQNALPPDQREDGSSAHPIPSDQHTQGPQTLAEPQKEKSARNSSNNPPQPTVAAKPSPAIPFLPARNRNSPRPVQNDVRPAAQPVEALRVVPNKVNKSPANNVPPPPVESLAGSQSQADKIASLVNSAPLPLRYNPPLDLKDKNSAKEKARSELPPKAETPPRLLGLVAIRTDPYPALRMSTENGRKKSKKTARLQLGHLVSRVEPVYPDEAKQRGIEGTVTVHAIIGRSGSVESVTAVNGPPLLTPVVTSAVRQWRYTETLLAGQPVETEEDIDVTFRLSSPTASQK
jgi:TonB family protein